MADPGYQALARVLKKLSADAIGDEEADALAREIWPDFRGAVAQAMGEVREARRERGPLRRDPSAKAKRVES